MVCLSLHSSGYVAKLYDTLITTPREELERLKEELAAQVPEPLHNMLNDKESKDEAKEKFLARKKKETVICPPTCSGTILTFFLHIDTQAPRVMYVNNMLTEAFKRVQK